MNIEDIMEVLFQNRAKDLPHDALAEVFDRRIWCLEDNGAAICAVKEKWLQGDSFERCSIALNMSETFPFDTAGEMKSSFANIVKKWPELNEKCNQIIERRAKQNV